MTDNATGMRIDRSISIDPARDALAARATRVVLRLLEQYAARRSAQAMSRIAVFDASLAAQIKECADTMQAASDSAKSNKD